jgi:hypothetical protein
MRSHNCTACGHKWQEQSTTTVCPRCEDVVARACSELLNGENGIVMEEHGDAYWILHTASNLHIAIEKGKFTTFTDAMYEVCDVIDALLGIINGTGIILPLHGDILPEG